MDLHDLRIMADSMIKYRFPGLKDKIHTEVRFSRGGYFGIVMIAEVSIIAAHKDIQTFNRELSIVDQEKIRKASDPHEAGHLLQALTVFRVYDAEPNEDGWILGDGDDSLAVDLIGLDKAQIWLRYLYDNEA
jgi:hypothetical protein